jgi:agmatine/peptidylarginine deiminase
MPADFERQSAILLGVNELLPYHPQLLVGVVAGLIDRLPVIAMVTGESQRRDLLATLCDWGLPAHLIHCVRSPARGLWVRDYGPTFVRRHDRVWVLDAEYHFTYRDTDDRFPAEFADLLGVYLRHVPLIVEGGNVLSNGRGLALCTTALLDRNEGRYTPAQTLEVLSSNYGFNRVGLVRPLIGGPTAHTDMFATFTAADTLVLGQYDPAHDPDNARLLDQTAAQLRGIDTGAGPLKIERIPMPPHADGIWRTYANVIYANDVVIVPSYAGVDPGLEREAVATYRRLLPGREVVAVEATALARTGGVLRCVSLNVPHLGHPMAFEDAAPTFPAAATAGPVAAGALSLAFGAGPVQ